jgi:hypothetical protein
MDTVKRINIHVFVLWYFASITALLFASFLLIFISTEKVVTPESQSFRLYAALPASASISSNEIVSKDARALIIENFFKGHKSPLAEHGDIFVQTADKYDFDYRLLPAISMQESNGGKKVIPDSHNPFGYGIYGSKVTKFNSWAEAIEQVGKALREDYLNEGLTTPETIMIKYTPPSAATDGAWAKGVSFFMYELK